MLLLTLTRADWLILGVAFDPSYSETGFATGEFRGAPKSEILEYNGLLYRTFEEGVVVVNPYKAERELRVQTGGSLPRAQLPRL
jgi:hypothetical protein